MQTQSNHNNDLILVKYYIGILLLVWTAIVAGLCVSGILNEYKHTREHAKLEARAHFNKDQAFRFWSASHGGIYVPTDERTPPNPHLAQIPERDIETPSGKKLTLMNPAYMLRQMMEDYSDLYGVKGRITSLKPFRPENTPDEWERKALEAFDRGETEVSEFTDIEGEPYLRLMRPMNTKEACLKCHAIQGYQVGDVRGGVGISLPLTPLLLHERFANTFRVISYLLLWILGLAGIAFGYRQIRKRTHERSQMQKEIERARDDWERMFESVPDLIAILDLQHSIRKVNKAMANRLGITPEEAVGATCYECIHGTEEPPEFCPHTMLINDGIEHTVEVYEERLGGWFNVSTSPIHDDTGQLIGSVHVARDITSRKKIEREMEHRAEFERIISLISSDIMQFGVGELDTRMQHGLKTIGEFTGADRAYVFLFRENNRLIDNTHEWCAEGIEPQIDNLKDVLVDEELPWFAERIKRNEICHIPDVEALPLEAELEKAHFEEQDIQSLIVVPMAHSEAIIGFLGFDSVCEKKTWSEDSQVLLQFAGEIFTTALERRRARRELIESEKRYRLLIKNIPVGVYRNTPGPEGRFLMANPAIVAMFGYETVEEFLQVPVSHLYENYKDRQAFLDKLIAQGHVVAEELELKKCDGTPIFASTTAKVVYSKSGEIEYIDGIIEDITERKLAEKALKESERIYRSAIEVAGAVPYSQNYLKDTYDFVGPGIEPLTGYSPDEFTYEIWLSLNQEIILLQTSLIETNHPSKIPKFLGPIRAKRT